MNTDPLLEMALNQRFFLCPFLGRNDAGKLSYGDPIEIKGRMSFKSRQLVGPDGEQIQSSARLTTTADIKIGDQLIVDGVKWPVRMVHAPVTFEGSIHRRKAYI